jgi:hypothetical protein
MKTIVIDVLTENWISLKIDSQGKNGTVESNLKQVCPFCQESNCYHDCDLSTAHMTGDTQEAKEHNDRTETEDEVEERLNFNKAIDVLESFVLALACAGIYVEGEQFREAVETTLEALDNNL